MKKKLFAIALMTMVALTIFAGCGSDDTKSSATFDDSKEITVISREDGSGTRTAFIELVGVEVKNADGTKKDMTTEEAVIAKATDVMMTTVANDNYAIGYISLGSLNDTVKAAQVDGVDATPENVKNGSYVIQRPFHIVTKGTPNNLAQDFIDFILSSDGQAVVSNGYIAVDDSTPAYSGSKPSGTLVIAGSSSVTPIMEKLKEAYLAVNKNAKVEIQQSDSSAGITGTIDGTCDIGMVSRDLKPEELKEVDPTQIAIDGIAIVINKNNPTNSLSKDQIKGIYTGENLTWSELN
ncbi:MAG: extracellular solute-binding protein [Clostridiales Family XIII bacterium]|nr:extracellular solute-binding protein [Clostridiales Family XIII bacterium]